LDHEVPNGGHGPFIDPAVALFSATLEEKEVGHCGRKRVGSVFDPDPENRRPIDGDIGCSGG
jgi:hypothetical protein